MSGQRTLAERTPPSGLDRDGLCTRRTSRGWLGHRRFGRLRNRNVGCIAVLVRNWRGLHRLVFRLCHRLSRHFLSRKFGRALQPVPLLALRMFPGAAALALRRCRRAPSDLLALQARALGAAVPLAAVALRTHRHLASATPTYKLPPDLRRRAHARPSRAAFWTTAPASAITTRGASPPRDRQEGSGGRPEPSLFSAPAILGLLRQLGPDLDRGGSRSRPAGALPRPALWIIIPPPDGSVLGRR